MGFGFLNIWMLLGLAAIALPVLAHLISKRRFDIVSWGAMRFLELGQRTRQRIRLQDFLLLFLRMCLLGLVALALARPWGTGRLLGAFGKSLPRDYVFILDGSGSMAWEELAPGQRGKPSTPHQQAIQWLFDVFEKLQPEDTVAVIDARSEPRRLLAPPTRDRKAAREMLAKIAGPAGLSRIPEAVESGLKLLATTSNPSRRVLVLTDNQRLAWEPDQEIAWTRISELQKQFQIPPSLLVRMFGPEDQLRDNFSVGKVELSRDVTVPDFPIKVKAMIRQSGGTTSVRRHVLFQIDGQQIPGKETDVEVPPRGEVLVEFEHSFPAIGNFITSISIDADALPQDDRSSAVVSVTSSIPVLLVDGDSQIDPTRSETFYLQSLFASSGHQSPWIKATTIRPQELHERQLRNQQVAFLCNVASLTSSQWDSLRKFVRNGGGLVIAPGDQSPPATWNLVDQNEKMPFLPATLKQIVLENSLPEPGGATIDSSSLEAPWLQRFRQENGIDLVQTRFRKWVRLEPVLRDSQTAPPRADSSGQEHEAEDGFESPEERNVRILARLSSGDPWLLRRQYGSGAVMQLATPLDADWSTLPAKNDFVPFVHELVFSLTASRDQRNLSPGLPLLLPLKGGEDAGQFIVSGPGVHNQPTDLFQRGQQIFARFRQTEAPGIYRFHHPAEPMDRGEPFVVDDDHRESDLTPMSPADWERVQQQSHLQVVQSMNEVTTSTRAETPRIEIWWLLLLLVLGLLIGEAALTRKMVQGGHAAVDAVLEN